MPRILRQEPDPFTYASLCSGIEAATVAWHPLGWQPAFFSEIDPFASAVLAHHWPEVPNLGDMTKHKEWNHAKIDLLVGGTPCQAFSVAGLRNGLADARGNLTLTFIDIADQFDPDWIVWENVPGVLSSKDNAFGCFLGGLAGEDDALVPPGGKWANAGCVFGPKRTVAWRVLDAQYFGVAQRRRRVFVVASPRHREGPCAVLFEREGVRRDSPPSREKGEGFTHPVAPCIGASGRGFERGGDTRDELIVPVTINTLTSRMQGSSGWAPYNETAHLVPTFWNGEQVTQTLDAVLAKGQTMPEKNRFPAVLVPATTHTLKAEGFDASEDGTGRGVPLVPVAFNDVAGTLKANGAKSGAENGAEICSRLVGVPAITGPMAANGGTGKKHGYGMGQQDWENGFCLPTPAMQVRRLTPQECMLLQGFPTDYLETRYANANEAHSAQVLHCLWREAGTQAFEKQGWRTRIAAALFTPEVLLAGVYVGWLSWSLARRCAATSGALACPATVQENILRHLRVAEELRYPPQRRESFEQLAGELGMPVSELPCEAPQIRTHLQNSRVWAEAQSLWPLRYALAAGKSPEKANPDGPRYRAIGNSMAVPVMNWIGRRIQRFMEGTL